MGRTAVAIGRSLPVPQCPKVLSHGRERSKGLCDDQTKSFHEVRHDRRPFCYQPLLTQTDWLAIDHDIGRVVVKDRWDVFALWCTRCSGARTSLKVSKDIFEQVKMRKLLTGKAFVV